MTVKIDWDNPEQDRLKLLKYGVPGSGKTWFAASAADVPEMSPVLILSARGNPESLRRRVFTGERPDVFVISQLDDLNVFYDFLAAGQPKDAGVVERLGLNPPYKTVVVDGMTELQRFTLAKAGGYDKLKIGQQGRQLQIQEFNPVLEHTVRMSALFFSLGDPVAPYPVHVIITCLEWQKLDMATGLRDCRPLIWGSAGDEMMGYSLAVCRIQQGSAISKRVLRTLPDIDVANPRFTIAWWRPQPRTVMKDQYLALGDYMINPRMSDVYGLVYGGVEAIQEQSSVVDEDELEPEPKVT